MLPGNNSSGPISWPLEPDTNFTLPLSLQSPFSSSPSFTSDIDILVDFDPFLFGSRTMEQSWQSPSSWYSSFVAFGHEPPLSQPNRPPPSVGNIMLSNAIGRTTAAIPFVHDSNTAAELDSFSGDIMPTLSLVRLQMPMQRDTDAVTLSSDREDREKSPQR